MTGFINQLLGRHTAAEPVITPRLPGLFEAETAAPSLSETAIHSEIPTAAFQPVHEPLPVYNPQPLIQTPANNNEQNDAVHPHDQPGSKTYQPGMFSHPEESAFNMPDKEDSITNISHQHITAQTYYPAQNNFYTMQDNIPVQHSLLYDDWYRIPPLPAEHRKEDSQPVSLQKDKPAGTIKEAYPGITGAKNPAPVVLPSVQSAAHAANTISAPLLQQENSTVIKVSIGRIEVRAMTTPAPVKKTRTAASVPKMTLQEYLNKRNNSGK
jgi:hypothetical protein